MGAILFMGEWAVSTSDQWVHATTLEPIASEQKRIGQQQKTANGEQ